MDREVGCSIECPAAVRLIVWREAHLLDRLRTRRGDGPTSARRLAVACLVLPLIALLVLAGPSAPARAADPTAGPTVIPSAHNDVSRPLWFMAKEAGKSDSDRREIPHRE